MPAPVQDLGNNAVKAEAHVALGKVASPAGSESTSEEFCFWAPEDVLVEKSQIVHVSSDYASGCITFHAVVDEVYRRSRRKDVIEEADRYGGDPKSVLPLDSQGVTYARARILASAPPVLAPPREESPVVLSGRAEARVAYGVDDMGAPLPIGLLKNGGDAYAGPAYIDLDYVLGANGANLNVNGVSGVATKSSFLITVLYRLLAHCRAYAAAHPSASDKQAIVPIVLNVKGYDLLWLDHANKEYAPDDEDVVWEEIGITKPGPLADARFLAPEQASARAAVPVGRNVERYSWSFADVMVGNLFPYLFGDDDRDDENFLALLQDIEALMVEEEQNAEQVERSLRPDAPQTFQEFLDWTGHETMATESERSLHSHHPGTWRKFYRRLRRIVNEGEGMLVRHEHQGRPLVVTAGETVGPQVVDITSIRDAALQRFVVAAIFAQVSEARMGTNAVPNLSYVIVLDELNRWAPRGATDPITRLIERVVAEMRSQGVVLFGAQQQASQVSPRIIENCAIRVLGRTGSLELEQPLWGFLSKGTKRRAQGLGPSEKLVYQVNFREPMHVRMPFPCWAMRRADAVLADSKTTFDEREEWEK